MFRNEAGLKIFDEWIKKYGVDDVENSIGIRIIKGIDVGNPYWYRIGIGANSFFSSFKEHKNCVVINPCRMHTMQPNNAKNIALFEHMQSKSGDYIICPSIIKDGETSPEEHMERQILKHVGSLKIIYAYEVEKSDVLATESIISTDKPLIPPGFEKCDLVDILAHKNAIRS